MRVTLRSRSAEGWMRGLKMKEFVATVLILLILPRLDAQNPADPAPPRKLAIVTVGGEGAINNTGQVASQSPAVRIEDENARPLSGVSVVFTLPTEGPSGEFRRGDKTQVVVTEADGIATAHGMKANAVPGKLPIHVNASYRGLTARSNITQFIMSVPGRQPSASRKTLFVILAVAGGAAAGGGVALTSRKSSTPVAPAAVAVTPIGIGVGAGSVGPPR